MTSKDKRNWHAVGVRGSWGKRSSLPSDLSGPKYFIMSQDDYNKYMDDNLAKRTKGWIALRGMWGKRSDPELSNSNLGKNEDVDKENGKSSVNHQKDDN